MTPRPREKHNNTNARPLQQQQYSSSTPNANRPLLVVFSILIKTGRLLFFDIIACRI